MTGLMYEPRTPNPNRRRAPHDQFRCGACQRFVRGTEYGVCPRCGLAPPAVTVFGESGTELRREAAPRGTRPWLVLGLLTALAGLVFAWLVLAAA